MYTYICMCVCVCVLSHTNDKPKQQTANLNRNRNRNRNRNPKQRQKQNPKNPSSNHVSCADKPQTADFRQYLLRCCCKANLESERMSERERERRKQSRRVKHRFKLERLNSVTGNLSLAGPDRRTDGQARAKDWQVIHDDIETDGRRHWHVAWEFYFGWHSHSPIPIPTTTAIVFLIFPQHCATTLQKSSTRPGFFWLRKQSAKESIEKATKKTKHRFALYYEYILYFSRVYSPSLGFRLDYFGDLFFSPALSIVKILHKSKATKITTNRKAARGNNWINAKKAKGRQQTDEQTDKSRSRYSFSMSLTKTPNLFCLSFCCSCSCSGGALTWRGRVEVP